MPRPRVSAHERRRVSRACDICRRRKEKCDGNFPCKHCASRNAGAGCRYTPGIARRSDSVTSWAHQPTVSPSPSRQTNSGSLGSIETLLGRPPEPLSPTETDSLDCAQIPEQSRLLGDGRGKSFYIGESGSVSYLEIVRRSVADAIGSCIFADDPLQHQMYEKGVGNPLGTHMEPEPQPELEWCLALVGQFQLQVSGTVDLFDASWIEDKLPHWVADHNRRDRPESPVIFIVLSIGILSRASSGREEMMAESYFNYGRQLAFTHLMDEPSLLTVQTFCLISYYMMASCRGNGAFTHLGIATRAAYALGIHRHETNSAFVREAGIERERAWKSLRVCDLFLSASMGRPPATSEADCNVTEATSRPVKDRSNALASCQVSSAIFRICLVFERILVEVYSKRAVSLDLAASISQQHRLWAAELPSILKIDGLAGDQPDVNASTQKLGSRIVTMAYYYSIILLSRPFLSVQVGAHQAQASRKRCIGRTPDNVSTYADACVDSAIKGIALASDIAFDSFMPRRQPLIINSVFVSALALGHAYLGDYDQQGWPIANSLDSAIAILRHFSPGNPHAARYHDICCRLKDAVGLYTQKRADAFLKSTTRHVTDIFGDVQQDDSQGRRKWTSNSQPGDPCGEYYNKTDHSRTARELRCGNLSPVSPTAADGNPVEQSEGIQSMGGDDALCDRSHDPIDFLSTFTMNDFAFTEDVPLFSFMGGTDVGMYPAD